MRRAVTAVGCACLVMVSSASGQKPARLDSLMVGVVDSYRYFDHPVDPDLYLIRPGDELVVTFIRAKLPAVSLTVDPEGRVIDATIGIFDLSHKTLSAARQELQSALQSLYKADEIAISVAGPSKVAITVSGAVKRPGLYVAYTSQRVSEIIDTAGGVSPSGSRRRIILSGGPRDIMVDLDRAEFLGDLTANPCLYAGDRIYVPGKSDLLVQVVGEVANPREVELLPEDSLQLLLLLAGGARTNGDTSAMQIISESQSHASHADKIKAGDIILVPPKPTSITHASLTVYGAISRPGMYEFRPGLTLAELITQAGGFSPQANAARTTVFRKAEADEWGRPMTQRYPISNTVHGDGQVEQFPIRADDSVYVPVTMGYVKVRGEVHNAGLFPFRDNESALYYVTAAGGFLPTADKDQIHIINRVTKQTSVQSPAAIVHDGDEVIVNIRQELQ